MTALQIGQLHLPGNITGTHFCYRLSQYQGHTAAGRVCQRKIQVTKSGIWTRDLMAFSAVPQPNALSSVPISIGNSSITQSPNPRVPIWILVACKPWHSAAFVLLPC